MVGKEYSTAIPCERRVFGNNLQGLDVYMYLKGLASYDVGNECEYVDIKHCGSQSNIAKMLKKKVSTVKSSLQLMYDTGIIVKQNDKYVFPKVEGKYCLITRATSLELALIDFGENNKDKPYALYDFIILRNGFTCFKNRYYLYLINIVNEGKYSSSSSKTIPRLRHGVEMLVDRGYIKMDGDNIDDHPKVIYVKE